ncbi:unnamed protein product [Caenorhabditis angaria]|uniref:Uncharacterized protein n=1 Tax=Caenorhabditis angaria TaxID=860376 RepID=A0A9P1IHA3_9PELO|nr:unnamed protein product [Caenorhabditis angaria]
MNHHHVFVTSADEQNIQQQQHNNQHVVVTTTSQSDYQSTSYYSAAEGSYDQVGYQTTQIIGDDETKEEFLMLPSQVKEHPAVAQADTMNAYLDSYFVDQHGASTSDDSNDIRNRLIDERLRLERAKKSDEDLEVLLKETDDMQDIQTQIHMEQAAMADKYREERSRQRRAAAARSRYQRMTENERRLYNHRRRLRQLGLDPENSKTDMEEVREHVKNANAKKAEAARMRYHRMTPEQKRDYNMRRTEAFRRRRMEEEMLLSTPAGRISAEALAKAQQIMVRNARKAESARLRYQRMTPDERKQYNLKRAAAKKTRKKDDIVLSPGNVQIDPLLMMAPPESGRNETNDESMECFSDMSGIQESTGDNGSVYQDQLTTVDDATQEQHMLDIINQVATPTQHEIFAQMEKDVVRRTKQAHLALQRQQQLDNTVTLETILQNDLNNLSGGPSGGHSTGGPIQYDMAPPMEHEMIVETSGGNNIGGGGMQQQQQQQPTRSRGRGRGGIAQNRQNEPVMMCCEEEIVDIQDTTIVDKSQLIDEKALHEMLRTGLDANGQPVEIRMADGTPISGTDQLNAISNGQTILITQQQPIEQKPSLLPPVSDYGPSTSTHLRMNEYDHTLMGGGNGGHPEDDEAYMGDVTSMLSADKLALSRAKRAERARMRYHRMSVEERREQNARRADMLRRSRQRDDELCQLADSVPMEQLDEDTRRQIVEAQTRRMKRAEQARAKYHRMNSEQRRQYNAMRDAQRRQRKREQENRMRQQMADQDQNGDDMKVDDGSSRDGRQESSSHQSGQSPHDGSVLYANYDMYPAENWTE